MRSSKNRSRSKGNRNRSVGNVVNRVFDSSGPEGKVRGTPQQIIDKYNQLARDAQLSNDRVAAENFQQHAEHYTRLLGEAQREMEQRREQQEAQQREQREQRAQAEVNRPDEAAQPEVSAEGGTGGFNDVIGGAGAEAQSGLVETPEEGGKPSRGRGRRSRKPQDTPAAAPEATAEPAAAPSEPVADAGKPAAPPPEAAE